MATESQPHIRRPAPGDVAGIADLLDELGYPATAAQVTARLAALPEDELVLVAEFDGSIAGFGALRVERLIEQDEPAARLTALVVGAKYRRRGIGAALVAAVEAEARARGCGRIVLTSGTHRSDAHAFYGRVGYEITGRRFEKRLAATRDARAGSARTRK